MRIHFFLDPKPRTDLGRTSGKNLLLRDELVSIAYKVAKSVAETNSKMQEPKTYDEIINNPVHESR